MIAHSRSRVRRIALTSIAAALVLTTAGCGDSDDTAGERTETSATPSSTTVPGDESAGTTTLDVGGSPADECTEERKGGTLTMGVGALATALDPTIALGTGSSGGTELTAFYDTLMRYVPATGEYVPHLAESLTSNDDLTVWTLTLRDGVRFGNGDPVTAADVQFSIERVAASTRSAAGLAAEIVGFNVIDDQTIELTARTQNGNIPYTLATEVGMVLNEALVTERGEGFATNAKGAGAGPFELERFAPGEEIVLTAKTDYWGGLVCLDTLRFVSILGGQGTWDTFQAGELDVAFLSEVLIVNEARAAGVEAHSSISGGNGFLMLNNREGSATSDVRVRRAIALALDVDLIDARSTDGAGLPTSCIAHPQQALHPDVPCVEYDLDAAKALVEAAKADGWDGLIQMVFRNAPVSVENSIVIEALLTEAGMSPVRENLAPAAWSERVLAPPYEFDIGEYGLALLDAGPIARMNQFFSDSIRNRSGYGSDEMDAALNELTKALTSAEVVAAMGNVQEVWNDDVPSVIFNASEWFLAANDTVHGLLFNRDVTVMFQDAYIEG